MTASVVQRKLELVGADRRHVHGADAHGATEEDERAHG